MRACYTAKTAGVGKEIPEFRKTGILAVGAMTSWAVSWARVPRARPSRQPAEWGKAPFDPPQAAVLEYQIAVGPDHQLIAGPGTVLGQ